MDKIDKVKYNTSGRQIVAQGPNMNFTQKIFGPLKRVNVFPFIDYVKSFT